MLNVSLGNGSSHYNPNEPRDERGRWTIGGSSWRDAPLHDSSAVGCADLLLGHARYGLWQKGLIREFHLPTEAEARRFSQVLAAWNAASQLDDERFRDCFTRDLVDDLATVRRMRQAAAGSVQAQTIGQMIEASYPLTAAIKTIGASRWPRVLEGLQERAGVPPASKTQPLRDWRSATRRALIRS